MISYRIIAFLLAFLYSERACAFDDPLRDKLKEKLTRYCATAHFGYVNPGFHSVEVVGGVARVKTVGKFALSGQQMYASCVVGRYNNEIILAPGISAELFWMFAGARITPRCYTDFNHSAFGITAEAGINVFGRISVYFGRTFVSNNTSLFPFKYCNTLSLAIHFYQPKEKRK
jgi:hypothetical protein